MLISPEKKFEHLNEHSLSCGRSAYSSKLHPFCIRLQYVNAYCIAVELFFDVLPYTFVYVWSISLIHSFTAQYGYSDMHIFQRLNIICFVQLYLIF